MITRIRNFIFLYRLTEEKMRGSGNARFAEYLFRYYRGKTRIERNVAARAARWSRKMFPYRIQGWKESQKMYEDYFRMEGHIDYKELKKRFKKGEELFVSKFRCEVPVKGKKLFEYHVDGIGCFKDDFPQTFRVSSINEGFGLCKEHITAYRWATKEEIREYKNREARIEVVEDAIKAAQEEVKRLEKLKRGI